MAKENKRKTRRLQLAISERHFNLITEMGVLLEVDKKEVIQRALEAYFKVVRLSIREEKKLLAREPQQ